MKAHCVCLFLGFGMKHLQTLYTEIKVTWWSDLDSVCLFYFCHGMPVCSISAMVQQSAFYVSVCSVLYKAVDWSQNFGTWTYIYYGNWYMYIHDFCIGLRMFSFFFSSPHHGTHTHTHISPHHGTRIHTHTHAYTHMHTHTQRDWLQ